MNALLAVREVVATVRNRLRSNEEGFTELDLSYYAPDSDDEGGALEGQPLNQTEATVLVGALSVNTRMEKLTLWGAFRAFPESIRPFLETRLPNHSTLTYLSLGDCGLTSDHAELIGRAVKTNTALKTLSLMDNKIGDRGVKALMDGLRHNKHLENLDLEGNGIGLEGFQAIGSLLEKVCLKQLWINRNRAGDEGATALAEGLSKNKSLTLLWLTDTEIGDVGCQAFARAIRRNSTLKYLQLHSNRMTGAGVVALETSLRHLNFALERLSCDDDHVHYRHSSIARLCVENCRLNKANAALQRDLPAISLALWPRVVERFASKPDLIYSILKSKPDLCLKRRIQRKRRRPELLRY